MSIIAAIKGAQAGAKIAKVLAVIGGTALVVFLAYQWGRTAKGEDIAKLELKLNKEYTGQLLTATGDAYQRGVNAVQAETHNETDLNQIIDDAREAVDADRLCISADTVARLQQLQ